MSNVITNLQILFVKISLQICLFQPNMEINTHQSTSGFYRLLYTKESSYHSFAHVENVQPSQKSTILFNIIHTHRKTSQIVQTTTNRICNYTVAKLVANSSKNCKMHCKPLSNSTVTRYKLKSMDTQKTARSAPVAPPYHSSAHRKKNGL